MGFAACQVADPEGATHRKLLHFCEKPGTCCSRYKSAIRTVNCAQAPATNISNAIEHIAIDHFLEIDVL